MKKWICFLLVQLALAGAAAPVRAGSLGLTPAGTADGFTLSTYASGGSPGNYPFLAAAAMSNGNLAVVDWQNGFLRAYADVDGQTPGSALTSVFLPGVVNAADAGGSTYVSSQSSGIYRITDSTTLALAPVFTGGFQPIWGLAGNPVNGHLLGYGNGAAGSGIYDINPGFGSTLIAGGSFDGVAVSPDGTTVYGEINGNVIGYNIATHGQSFFYNGGGHGPDGTAVITGGIFNGYIVVNNNDGTVVLVAPDGSNPTIIASGGTRGDFVSPDANNGTLLLSQYGEMDRLGITGGTFGGTAPEPSSIALLGIAGLVGAACRGWRRRKLAAA